ncbi:P1 family peptidase [Martelella endophytica]|uniref:Peptidase T4 n=1 Tax=Martelella endophytica TaxID=1486262 RepID=A0A0D5LLS5_MAREN|nr:P1 family peptidase [Martelella endophytica]AJY44885.1 peptidase T4 [Martelella endophytica]
MLNLITDVAGLAVGHAQDLDLASGVTAIVFDRPATASGLSLGGAPGSRDQLLLDPARTVETVDAFVLSGGSAFGLDAPGGAQSALRAAGRGLAIGPALIPIVPGAILMDLLNGGDKDWGLHAPYRDLGYDACRNAAPGPFALGTIGAGTGATTVNLKGGLGSASATSVAGHVVGSLAAVNAMGSVTIGDGPHFWAAPLERDGEFGGLGMPSPLPEDWDRLRIKGGPTTATTIAVVATDARLTKQQAYRLAVMAHDGFARAIHPAHLPYDGDTVLSAATGVKDAPDDFAFAELCLLAMTTTARAIARGVHNAKALPQRGALPSWKDRFEKG